MIKLCIEDITLNQLEPKLLPFVQWKSISLSDTEGLPTEVLSEYLFKMSKPVMKSLIKNNRVDMSNFTDEQWWTLIVESFNEGYQLFDIVQIPYSVILKVIKDKALCARFASKMAETQKQMPVDLVVKNISSTHINEILFSGSNPALIDFIFSTEGMKLLKKHHNVNYLTYITSTEAEKLGRNVKNRTISPSILRRANACSNGISYCTKILKELNLDSITWDDAIKTIRANRKLQTREALREYMNWIASYARRMN